MAGSIEDSRHGMANSSDECPVCFHAEQLQRLQGCPSLFNILIVLYGPQVTTHTVLHADVKSDLNTLKCIVYGAGLELVRTPLAMLLKSEGLNLGKAT